MKIELFTRVLIPALVLSFCFCGTLYAELVEHPGLPNEEGVKINPLDPRLSNPNLPQREGVKTPPITMHAAFSTKLQFDSNVFLENEAEDADFLITLAPSVGLELPFGDNSLSIDYDFAPTIFSVNNEHSYIDQRIRGVALLNWTDYKLTLVDVYRHFSERSGSEDVARVKRQNNFLRAAISATQFDQLGFDVGYTFGVEDYIADDTLYSSGTQTLTYHDKDRFINVVDLIASYRFLPKTTLFVESYLGFIDYWTPKSSNSWYTETMLGVRGDLHKDFSADFKAGFRYQKYDKSEITDSNDFVGLVASGTMAYKRTKDDIFSLRLERSIYESTFSNMNYYNVNEVGLEYTHFFNNKVSGNIFSYYQLNLYPSDATVDGTRKRRRDHFAGVGALVRYDMNKWLSLNMSYEYRQRKSTFGTFNYKDNLITANGTIGF